MERRSDIPLIHSVEEVAQILGISRGLAYQQARAFIDSGGAMGIPTIKIGARYLVPDDALRRFLTIDLQGDSATSPSTGRSSTAA